MGTLHSRVGNLFSLLVLLAGLLSAQTTSGNLTGRVYDPTQATVPGADVVAHNVATGIETATMSSSSGDFRFDNLPIGTYTLTVTAAGFTKAELEKINVQLNQTVTANVR